MATFEVQVEGLTGLTIDGSSSPTQDELTQFLKDGVIEVTNRITKLRPQDIENFQRATSISDSQGVSVGGAQIISVIREAGVDGSSDGSTAWRSCRKISASMQSRVVDPDSLSFTSKYNPVYAMDDNKTINVYPTPSANNGFKIFYVNEEPRDITNNAALAYSHSDIKYFPNDKVYLVVLYASIKSLSNTLANKNNSLPTKPVFVAPALETIDSMSLPSVPLAPMLSDNSVSFTTTAPSFDEPAVAPDFADAENWINTEEDSEMLAARVQVIGAQLQQYSTDIQNSSQKMNKENVEYQAQLQKSIQDAQLSSQDDAQKLQLYSAEINNYQAQVQKEVQRWTNEEYGKKFSEWQKVYDGKLQEYSNDIQNYSATIQKAAADYGWIEKRMLKLQQEYDAAFAIMAPKQQQQ